MLKTFQKCPQKYWLKYIKKLPAPQKSSTFEKGKKIHALAHYYLRGDNIEKLEKALNNEEIQIWQNLKNNKFLSETYVNSEYNLSCQVDKYWVGGRLDALVKNNEEYFILDYKTGQAPLNAEFDFQTIVYLLCVSKKYSNNVKFVYIDLKNNQNHIIPLNNIYKYETNIINICQSIENFQPQEDIVHTKMCEFCEYKKFCI